MPLPGLLYAQVVKRTRRRRIVEVIHRVVIGTQAQVDAVLAPCGWQINTAIVERLNLSLRQRVAAIRRRSATPCKSETGLTQPLVVYLQPTDNSIRRQSGTIIPFHYRERGCHHDSKPVVLSASRGRSRVDLLPHSCRVP
jgi:hypothetical protein